MKESFDSPRAKKFFAESIEMLATQRPHSLRERGEHPSKFVFVSQKSGRVNRSTLYRIFANAAEEAGLPADTRHPHVLKHSLGVALVGANINLAVIKQALGHRSIASTAIYTQPSDDMAGKAVVAALASL